MTDAVLAARNIPGSSSSINVNDTTAHVAVLALFDDKIVAHTA
jgi:hypothetical protein